MEEVSCNKLLRSKSAFSLIELIFVIAVIAIIAAVAVPKLMDSKSNALITSIKQDIATITNSIQSHHMLNNGIEKISDAVTLNKSRWDIENKKVLFKVDEKPCITIEVDSTKLTVVIDKASSEFCNKMAENGIENQSFDLF